MWWNRVHSEEKARRFEVEKVDVPLDLVLQGEQTLNRGGRIQRRREMNRARSD